MEDSIFRISDDDEKKLFDQGHVVFDSSALLSFYGYTDKISEEYFNKVFKVLENRLWLPAQVIYEFEKNRKKVINKPKGDYQNLINSNNRKEGGFLDSVKNAISAVRKNFVNINGQINALSEKTIKDDKHPHIKQDSIQIFKQKMVDFESSIDNIGLAFEGLLADTKEQVDYKINEIEENSNNDNLRDSLNTYFSIGKQYSYEHLLSIIREGKFRYENEIPPGYKDEDDKIGFQMYGDLILWFQIIDYAKDGKCPIIFVTNDVKEDWWHQENDKSIPRHELLYEFKDKTKQDIWFYTTDQLIYKSNQFLKTDISEDVIEEVKTANVNANEIEWLELLQDALDSNELVKANHRYIDELFNNWN